MARRTCLAALVAVALLIGTLPAASAADATPPLPGSIAAVGDSITQAASSGGGLGTDYPANSWSTGTNSTVASHYLRLAALNPSITGHAFNRSVSGAKMVDLAAQVSGAASLHPDYLTILVGGNDLCTPTFAGMTSVADFRAQFLTAMDALESASPGTYVYVVSIPDAYQLWQLFHTNSWARFIWSIGSVCQSLLANPTSTTTADVQRRSQVRQRNIDFNAQLQQVCALYPRCHFDGNAAFSTVFAASDIAGDYFHPSITGQAKLAAVTWAAGFWPNGGPAIDNPPTAAFSAGCSGLACTFDGSSSTDDHPIVAYDWTFGDGTSATGMSASHAYGAAGTYGVTLTVTDTVGQTATATRSVSVAASPPVHVSSLSGTSALRKSGWTATVNVSVAGPSGAVGGATVNGTWSTGGSGGCTTAANGSCSFSATMGRKTGSVTYTVSNVAATGYVYDAGLNVRTFVTISAP